jgi:hypothetical protein
MRVKKNRELVILIILIAIFLFGAFYISSRMENQLPQFSIENKSSTGCSIFYEALKKLKLPVERTIKGVQEQDVDSIQFVVPGGSFDINSNEVKNWVKKGGVLVSLSSGNIHVIDYGLPEKIKGSLSLYNYGNGTIIASDINNITNKTLMDKTNSAYELLSEMGSYDKKNIYFNETYLFSQSSNKNLWDYMPLWAKFVAYQFILVLAVYFYYKGRRFGKAIPLYEEVERTENEYLYSASSLYRQAKGYDLILDNYYKNLLNEINSNHENWVEQWEKQHLPSITEARKIYEFMDAEKKRKPKEYILAVAQMERLTDIIKQRRDLYWKTLKKTK